MCQTSASESADLAKNYPTAGNANSSSVNGCNSQDPQNNCYCALTFPSGYCGALAWAPNQAAGLAWTQGNNLALTEQDAIVECMDMGGVNCVVALSYCQT